jgi:hypothetical protein
MVPAVYPSLPSYLNTTFGNCKGDKLGVQPGSAAQKASFISGEDLIERRALPRRHSKINIEGRR